MRMLAAGAFCLVVGAAGMARAQAAVDLLDGAVNPAVEAQAQGDFGRMTRSPLGAIQGAWDDAPDRSGVVRFAYGPDSTYKVRTREGMTLTLVLPRWEEIEDVAYGSSLVEEIKRLRNKVTVFGTAVGADTNVTVFSKSGEVYHFYVRVEGYNSAQVPDGVAIVERPAPGYLSSASAGGRPGPGGVGRPVPLGAPGAFVASAPAGALGAGAGGVAVPDFTNPGVAAGLDFRFVMKGSRELAPDVVYRDSRFTYLYWTPERWRETDFPAIFRVSDEVDEPISTVEVIGTTVVVKELGALALISGGLQTCILPDGWSPGAGRGPGSRPVS